MNDLDRPRKFPPLTPAHVVDGTLPCIVCGDTFVVGDVTTLIPLGPGKDSEARARAREGRSYNAVALLCHWACITGEE
jgi:hypothetical protein